MDLMNNWKRVLTSGAAIIAIAMGASACSAQPETQDDRLQVLAAFYPLQFVSERVGGDLVTVSSLTPQGAEPHDLELAPAHTRKISTADLVVYQSGFQAAVDSAIEARDPEHVYDAGPLADLDSTHSHEGETAEEHAEHADEHSHEGETAEEHAEHADEPADVAGVAPQAGDHDGHNHGALDPHFWLDPTLLIEAANGIATELAAIDPTNAEKFHANARALSTELTELDHDFTAVLRTCTQRSIVVSHEAFGYLAHRYDFEQIGISGIDPEAEPSPAALRAIKQEIEARGITTIFFEALSSPKVVQTLAKDLGITAQMLDPIEGLRDPAQDYFSVQRANLTALQAGMDCS